MRGSCLRFTTVSCLVLLLSVVHTADQSATEVLRNASFEGNVDAVRAAIREGGDVNAVTDEDGESMLHLACVWGKPAVVAELLEKNADPNVRAIGTRSNRMTPLTWCAFAGFSEAVAELLNGRADPNAIVDSNSGERLTALDIAYKIGEQGETTAEILLSHGGQTVSQIEGVGRDTEEVEL